MTEIAAQPAPDPAMFGGSSEDDGTRNDIILAAGTESAGEMANRGGHAAAERLGSEAVVFPSHHGGFLGGEYGWPGEPDAFAGSCARCSRPPERR